MNSPAKIVHPNKASPTGTANVAVNPIDDPIEFLSYRRRELPGWLGDSGGFVASAEYAGVLMGGILTPRNAPARARTAAAK